MTTEIIIPTNQADITAINNAVSEGVDSMIRIDSEKTLIKEILEMTKEKYGIAPSVMRKLIKTKFKGTFETEVQQNDDFSALYETVVK